MLVSMIVKGPIMMFSGMGPDPPSVRRATGPNSVRTGSR